MASGSVDRAMAVDAGRAKDVVDEEDEREDDETDPTKRYFRFFLLIC